jgi:hypothetical protein
LATAACVLLGQTPASAILIETAAKKRVAGFVESDDAKQISVRVKSANGKEKVEVFERSQIKILHQIDSARLEKLSKDKPGAYRDYAHELAEKTDDPEAVELALRLYLIAAYLEPQKMGRSCLLNMSALTTRPDEVRRYRAMAFLLDAKSNPALLKVETVPPALSKGGEAAKAPMKGLTDFQKALKLYRTGQAKSAKNYASDKAVAPYFAKAGLKDQKSFAKACNDLACAKCKSGNLTCTACTGKGKIVDMFGMGFQACTTCNGKGTQKCTTCDGFGVNPFPEDYLTKVLQAEIWALEQMAPPGAETQQSTGWSHALNSAPAPIPQLSLETITPFDPRACVYRKGSWSIP